MEDGKVRLRTFGGISLLAPDGSPLSGFAAQRKAVALLILLARSGPRGLARDKILSCLWPESTTDQARNALNNLLFRLRRAFGADSVIGGGELILNSSRVSSDVGEFDAAVAAEQLELAASLYAGPFLDGFYVRDAPEFERWSADERARLFSAYCELVERLAGTASARGDRVAAVKWWRKRADAEPLSSRVARGYADALITAGERETALSFLVAHGTLVRVELGTQPDPGLTRLADELRRPMAAENTTDSRESSVTAAEPEQLAGGSTVARSEAAAAAHVEPARTSLVPHRGSRRLFSWGIVGTAAAGIIATVAAATMRHGHSAPVPADALDRSRVMVAGFANHTGDSTLDYVGYVVADWITQGLSQSEYATVVYGPTAFELSRSTAPMESAADAERIRLLSSRTGAGTIVRGSYYLMHDSIVVSAEIMDARTARLLRTVPPIAAPKSDPMQAVTVLRERAVGALATLLDARLASLSGLSSPPPLVEAYRAYLDGLELFRRGEPDQRSIDRFLLAAHLDTSFMLPVIWAVMRSPRGTPLRDSLLLVLKAHRDKLAPVDRYGFEFLEAADTDSSLQQLIAAGSRISSLAPGSNWSFMYAADLFAAGDSHHALDLLERIDPEHGWAGVYHDYWVILDNVQHDLGRYTDELETAQRAKMFGPKMGHPELGRVAAIKALIGLGRTDTGMALVRLALPLMAQKDRLDLLGVTARALRATGDRAAADSLFSTVLNWYRAHWNDPDARSNRASYLDYELQSGQLSDAQASAEGILVDPASRRSYTLAHAVLGVLAANRGDRTAALEQIRQISSLETDNHFSRWNGAKLNAIVAGALHDRQLALQYLGEMEMHGLANGSAKVIAYAYYELNWLRHDPRLELAYVGGTP